MHASTARERGARRRQGPLNDERRWKGHSGCRKAGGSLPLFRPCSAPGPWKGRDSPLEASSVRAGRSGPSGLTRGHSMSGRHILRRARAERPGGGESRSPLPKRLPPPSRRLRSGKLVPSCHLLPAGVGGCLRGGGHSAPGVSGLRWGSWGGGSTLGWWEVGLCEAEGEGRVVADGSCGVVISSAHLPSSSFASTSLHLAHHHPLLSHFPYFLISLKLPGRQVEGREWGRGEGQGRALADVAGWGCGQCGPSGPHARSSPGPALGLPLLSHPALGRASGASSLGLQSPNFRVPHAPQVFTSLCASHAASQVPFLGPSAVLPSPRLLFPGRAPDPVSRPPSQ